ncbi:hypothetical protein FXO37_18272 [Capsicum annuum]|nr:hypothetical protein FXO37_18272 [Capsicum annuum]
MVKEGIVLGHKISVKGIEVDQDKFEDFSKIGHPMCKLLEKESKFSFDESRFKAFEHLKELLISALIIVALDWLSPLEVMGDPSGSVLGTVLG